MSLLGTYIKDPWRPSSCLAVLLALALLAGSLGLARAGESPAGLAARAQALYEKRANLQVAGQAAKLYREILKAHPQDLDASLKLCELLVWIGAQADSPADEPYYREVIVVAGQARRLHPRDPGPVYWLGVGQGMLATVASIGEALSLVKKARANMGLLLSMDPTYYYGGADRVLGRIYSKLPFFIGGDNQKAELHYKQAIHRGPPLLAEPPVPGRAVPPRRPRGQGQAAPAPDRRRPHHQWPGARVPPVAGSGPQAPDPRGVSGVALLCYPENLGRRRPARG